MKKGLFILLLPALCACSGKDAGAGEVCSDDTCTVASNSSVNIATTQNISEHHDKLDSIADALNESAPVACGDYIEIANASYDGSCFTLVMHGNSGHFDFSRPGNKEKLSGMLRADLHKYYGEVARELFRRGQPLRFECYVDEAQIPSVTLELQPQELQPPTLAAPI